MPAKIIKIDLALTKLLQKLNGAVFLTHMGRCCSTLSHRLAFVHRKVPV